MNWNLSPFRLNLRYSKISVLVLPVVLLVFIFTLSLCDTGSEGRYKFQPESMHWLQFRGPNASGLAPDNADPPVHFNADTNLLWKTELIPGWSSPCIVDDKIFLTGFDNSDSLLYTIALNRENGEVLWRDSVIPNGYYDMHPINTYANPTIASNGNMIFASFPNYGLIAYDLNGNKAWEFHHEVIGWFYGGACSPVVADSVVIIVINSDSDPRIMAVDCQSGDSVWSIRASDHKWAYFNTKATPVMWKDLLILHLSRVIVAYDMTQGDPVWWLFTPNTGPATPIIMDDVLYINTWIQLGERNVRGEKLSFTDLLKKCDTNANERIEQDEFLEDMVFFHRPESPDAPRSAMFFKDDNFFESFDENGDGAFEENEWNALWEFASLYMEDHGMLALPLEGAGERPATDIKWKINEDTPETPSPLVIGENILFIKNGGIMTVINRGSGEVVFKDRIGAAGTYLSSPMLAGDRVYTCSYNGRVTVLSAEDFSVLAHNKLKEKIGASPVAVDDVLYIRTNKHFYAFRE